MKVPEVVTVDFETAGIERRPDYPPVPAGVSILEPGKRAKYYAWGHPTGNNCDFDGVKRRLQDIAKNASKRPILFHNGKFDVDVMVTHCGTVMPDWRHIHDTLFLLFLDDPHQLHLSLKPSAERLLGLPPEEQDAVKDWLVEKRIVRSNQKDWGAHICKAPANIVGPYANGDTTRTRDLFRLLYPRIAEMGMQEAYDRERQLMPILLENERHGIRIDVETLLRELELYEEALLKADEWLRKRLKAPGLDFEKDRAVADAFDSAGVVDEWTHTPTGLKSVAKDALPPSAFSDPRVAAVYGYRNRLTTCLSTFMRPWANMAQHDGRIYTNWNQVRNTEKGSVGARTGRLSCSPNFMNIPKSFEGKGDGYVHPAFLRSLPQLPLIRRYVLPDKGCAFGHRDYSQQELRILAHFEDDKLRDAYISDPRIDLHDFVRAQLEARGIFLDRTGVKTINFGMLYGMGLGTLALRLDMSVDEAKKIKAAQRSVLPGLAQVEKDIRGTIKAGEPIYTWGGRAYYCEPPRIVKNKKTGKERYMTFEYKLLNYLIQGSAADCTKQAVINYNELRKEGRFLVTVHDEINICAPPRKLKAELKRLDEAMRAVEFDVPMVTDAKTGPNWGTLTKLEG